MILPETSGLYLVAIGSKWNKKVTWEICEFFAGMFVFPEGLNYEMYPDNYKAVAWKPLPPLPEWDGT